MLEIGPTAILQFINFLILLFILKKLLWKPLIESLDARQNRIATQVKEAEAINIEAKELKARYEAQIAEAKAERTRIIREATVTAETVKEQIVTEAREEASRVLRQAEREAVSERERAMAEVKAHVADLVVTAASKVLKDSLDRETQDKLMADFVHKVGEKYVN